MLYYIKQHISKFVVAGDDGATLEGQSDNSNDTIIPICVETSMEVKACSYWPSRMLKMRIKKIRRNSSMLDRVYHRLKQFLTLLYFLSYFVCLSLSGVH